MAAQTEIGWTDSTFNGWIGCTKVSPACDNCYAAVATPSRTMSIEWGSGKPRYLTSAANWKMPLRWNAQAEEFRQCDVCGWRGIRKPRWAVCQNCKNGLMQPTRRRVFCSSLADVFDNEVPAEWLADLLDLIRCTPNIDWLLLTKRIGNWRSRLKDAFASISGCGGSIALRDWIGNWLYDIPPPNVWIGATICNQAEADRDVPKLLCVPAAVRFLSIEPMLGPIDLTDITTKFDGGSDHFSALYDPDDDCADTTPYVNWVITGAESGSHARPCEPQFFRSIRDQCAAAGTAYLHKQNGEFLPADSDECDPCIDPAKLRWSDGSEWHEWDGQRGGVTLMARVGKKTAGRLLDGRIHHEFPEVRHV